MDTGCTDETSDTISMSPTTIMVSIQPEKLCRVRSGSSVVVDTENDIEAESRKLPSSQYKGVVPQPNGRWGAQIYEKHQRVWLGTFNEEKEAAKAYDIAAQSLFEKAVTPSDVGKLNRLVIPKQHAEKHFPLQIGTTCKGMLLNFEDKGGKVWRFRYSYWNSSQSYVLTKGWSRFVKEKKLQAGDVVSFLQSSGEDKQLYIDWKSRASSGPIELHNQIYPVNSVNLVQPAVQVVRLFGVNIFKIPVSSVVVDYGSWNGKRMRDVDFLSVECCKKQCLGEAL
ncbi:hypothetical protein IFM89_020080 [Coptis chinensis]|uniref:Uncharacterized protein n=1 Tax=Coptis chinensis TaxID=261450 RepID=A0A835HD00_9MAGN|nr:hypothetical protein IFM89_020080 [Coptis chinensis]